MASYQKHLNPKAREPLDPNLYQNHWTIGDEGAATQSKTTYTAAHKNFGPATVQQARDQTQDRGSNWKLGSQTVNYQTESATQ
jgi:hypothetical protein